MTTYSQFFFFLRGDNLCLRGDNICFGKISNVGSVSDGNMGVQCFKQIYTPEMPQDPSVTAAHDS